ncbi:MAG: hypothetical protein QNJ37_12050 [Crocosphaera sp.]|nr:hypothetical protein [Crocosphaera sp.]
MGKPPLLFIPLPTSAIVLSNNNNTILSRLRYDHLRLAEIAQNQLNHLILDITRYPSNYFPSEILETAKSTANKP